MATFRPSGISIYIRQDLDEGAARSGTTLIIDPIITADGHRVIMSDIGDICFAKIDQGTSNEEIISFTGITDNTSTYTLTGCVWGYNFYNSTGSIADNQKKHISGSKIIITNDDHFLSLQYVNVDSTQTIAGAKTFTVTPQSNGGNPAVGTDLVIKSYVDALVLGTLTTINVIVPGKAGENVAIGQLIYFDETDNEWKLTDADTATTVQNVLLGIAQGSGTNGNAIANGILLQGVDTHQLGLSEGDVQYAGNTAGSISASAGTTEVTVGLAKSATELYFNPRFNQQLTEDQQDALVGTSGTPSATNKYVTNDDTATAATADKVARRLANGNITVVTESLGNNSTNAASTAYVDATAGGYFGANGDSTFYAYQLPVNAADNWYVEDTSFTVTSASYATLISSAATWRIYTTIAGYGSRDGYIWSDGKDLIAEFRLKVAGVTTDDIFMGFGNSTRMDGAYNSTETCVGFSIDGSNLYGTTANGTTATLSTAIAGITTSNWNLYKIVLNPGTDAKFYVNGVLKATITTTLPNNGNTVLFGVGSPSTSTDAYLMPVTIRQEL